MMGNRLFELVDESNGQLVDAAEDSFSQMISHSAGMLSREIGEKIDSVCTSFDADSSCSSFSLAPLPFMLTLPPCMPAARIFGGFQRV